MDWSVINRTFIKYVLEPSPESVLPFYIDSFWIDFLIGQVYQWKLTDEISSAPELAACVLQVLILNDQDNEENLEPEKFKLYMTLYSDELFSERGKRSRTIKQRPRRKNIVSLKTIFSKKRIDSLTVVLSKPGTIYPRYRTFPDSFYF